VGYAILELLSNAFPLVNLFQPAFFLGTFALFFRASESPMAIACLRLFTAPPLPPLPERNVPCFLRRRALWTLFRADFPYLAILPPTLNIDLTPDPNPGAWAALLPFRLSV